MARPKRMGAYNALDDLLPGPAWSAPGDEEPGWGAPQDGEPGWDLSTAGTAGGPAPPSRRPRLEPVPDPPGPGRRRSRDRRASANALDELLPGPRGGVGVDELLPGPSAPAGRRLGVAPRPRAPGGTSGSGTRSTARRRPPRPTRPRPHPRPRPRSGSASGCPPTWSRRPGTRSPTWPGRPTGPNLRRSPSVRCGSSSPAWPSPTTTASRSHPGTADPHPPAVTRALGRVATVRRCPAATLSRSPPCWPASSWSPRPAPSPTWPARAPTGRAVTSGAPATRQPRAAKRKPGPVWATGAPVRVVMNDRLRYRPAAIMVWAGRRVTFDVTNVGKLPHEFILGDRATQLDHGARCSTRPPPAATPTSTGPTQPPAPAAPSPPTGPDKAPVLDLRPAGDRPLRLPRPRPLGRRHEGHHRGPVPQPPPAPPALSRLPR